MKKEINLLRILLIGIAMLAVCVAAAFGLAGNQVNYDELTEVRIKEKGTMIPSGVEYSLTFKDGTWFASRNEISWSEENTKEMVADDVFVSKIIEILKKTKCTNGMILI